MHVHQVVEFASDGAGLVHVPIIGPLRCANFRSPADDFLEGTLELPCWLAPNLPGTSAGNFASVSIFDRDHAIVAHSLKALHKIVVAAVDGEMTLRRFQIEGGVACPPSTTRTCRPLQ